MVPKVAAVSLVVVLLAAAGVVVAYGASILFIDLVKLLARTVFNDIRCAVLHGGGTGAHCVKPRQS